MVASISVGALSRRWQLLLPCGIFVLCVISYLAWLPGTRFDPAWNEVWDEHGHNAGDFAPAHNGFDGDQNDMSLPLNPRDHIHRAATTLTFEWNITRAVRRPDGVAKSVYLIDSRFPGPTIEARSGDTIVVVVRNQLSEDEYEEAGVAIHWHGLQIANEMDGVPGVTQHPIRRGEEFTYTLRISDEQSGTFFYHSHSALQRAEGFYGALVVHKPAAQASDELAEYGSEQVLMVGDWYHRAARDVLSYYTDWKNFRIEPVPDSLLVNGKGRFNCSKAVPARPVDCEDGDIPYLDLPQSRTRLRVINAGSSTGFTLSTGSHVMRPFKVDGDGEVASQQPPTQAIGVLYPGERVDLIVEPARTGQAGRSEIVIALDRENMRFPNLALTATQTFPVRIASPAGEEKPSHHLLQPPATEEIKIEPSTSLTSLQGPELPNPPFPLVPASAQDTILLYTTISYLAINSNRARGYINKTSWPPDAAESSTPQASSTTASNLTEALSSSNAFIPSVRHARWIDLILNNQDDKGHPFHLHGHSFYVLASHRPTRIGAYEAFNPFDGSAQHPPMELARPLRKDTVYVPSMGYVVLRFRADALGVWMFHCHVLWHQAVGMAMAIEVSPGEGGGGGGGG